MKILLEEQIQNLELVTKKLWNQIELVLNFRSDLEFSLNDAQIQNTIKRSQYIIKAKAPTVYKRPIRFS